MASQSQSLLQVRDLNVSFQTYAGQVKAVRGVSFDVGVQETLAIVGESGCGKTVTSKAVMRLLDRSGGKIKEGSQILFQGQDLLALRKKELNQIRGNKISMIFQDSMTSLNPTMTVGKQIMENILTHKKIPKAEARQWAKELLELVEIPNPEMRLKQYPHQLSGGMRQRVMIAMALLCQPEVLIADEPTTALDVTIQAQILDLLRQLNQDFGTSIILITHDLGVIAEMADKVAVMYAGSIVETAQVRDLFHNPLHPYTRGLLTSLPSPQDDGRQELSTIEGNVPSIYNLPPGCAFHNRCKYARGICSREVPPTLQKGDQCVKCWMYADKWEQEVQE